MGYSTAFIGLDVHSKTSTICWTDRDGDVQGSHTFETSEERFLEHVRNIDAKDRILTLEEGPLAYWTARTLDPEVDRVLVCDPRENYLISRAIRKGDEPDAQALSRLLRMDELKEVYHPDDDRRALYKQACKHYIDLRKQQRRIKQKLKARLKRWGLWNIPGREVYSQSGRTAYLDELQHERIRTQAESLYRLLDRTHEEKTQARKELIELGRPYAEVQEFQKIPGIGALSAHIFDALIQTPHRFATKQKLWRYCKLGVRKHSSGGEETKIESLDPRGNGELKVIVDRAVRRAAGMDRENAIKTSYYQSLQRTGDETHARLNTERKLLAAMWGLWKNGTPYDPELFLG